MNFKRIVEEIKLTIYLVLFATVILTFLAVLGTGAYELYNAL
jgi:Na+-translocating ferredoxin:NAD+ oxidoreductase RnfE subunit